MVSDAIDPDRMARDIEAIAAFTEEDPRVGYSRPTFSPSWRRARDYVIGRASEAGFEARIDAAGNVHARRAGRGRTETAWMCGSHIDSVPTGGKYDGVVGVVVALEVLRAAPEAPLELVVFAEEEGTTFNLGMIGSRTWAGTLGLAELHELRNRQGEDYLSAGAPHGVAAERIQAERLEPGAYRGLIETHVEQGPALWKAGKPAAIVTAIAGRRQYLCTLTGEANHAGATRMADRRDALAGAARVVSALETLGRELDQQEGQSVITVGRLDVEPNAVNVIPGRALFTIDMRARRDEVLDHGDALVRRLLSEIAEERELQLLLECTESILPVPLDPAVCTRLRNAASRLGMDLSDTASGALHDTAILAPLLPAAMLFVASRNGISHNPAEYSRIEDIACAARIVAEAVCS
jgi:hydantoinase/carbamoylase family amidase